jgi:Histidine phosphatase superfamily (branch 1)
MKLSHIVVFAFACVAWAQPRPAFAQADSAATAAATAALAGPALLAALREGGYVLYLRHTSTDFGENDSQMTDYANCATQRNLTDGGRAEARAIGAALKQLAIPIGGVLASPYCRTLETGRLVFGMATPSLVVRGGPARPDNPDRYAELRALLATPVPRGTNIAIASHGNPFYGVAGPPYLAEGEMAVVEPLGEGRFRIVARIPKDGWKALRP